MHEWGGDFKYFREVGDAAEYIGDFCKRWGRFRGQTKEKYGTVRFYAMPHGVRSLFELTHPGWVSYAAARYPGWLVSLDIFFISRILNSGLLSPVQRLIYAYRCYVYKKAYSNAVKKWPQIREEILTDADALEILDDCDDIKLQWSPPCFSEKDLKRRAKLGL